MIYRVKEEEQKTKGHENGSDDTIFGRPQTFANVRKRMKPTAHRTLNVSRGVSEGREVLILRGCYC